MGVRGAFSHYAIITGIAGIDPRTGLGDRRARGADRYEPRRAARQEPFACSAPVYYRKLTFRLRGLPRN
jgi:hypothetical protein